jgi:hypothetical protein
MTTVLEGDEGSASDPGRSLLPGKTHYSFYRRLKGKAIQLQVWTGPEDSRSLRLPDFKTIGT